MQKDLVRNLISEHLNTRPRRGNITSRQVDLQNTCPNRQVEILENIRNTATFSHTLSILKFYYDSDPSLVS